MVDPNPFERFALPPIHDALGNPDAFLHSVGDLFALAADGQDVAENAMVGLRTIMDAATAGLTGASPHVVDLALTSLALSVERIGQHFSADINAADVDWGMRSAGGILRTFALSPDDADWPSSEDYLVWQDVVAILLSQMTGALRWQSIRARGDAYSSGLARAAVAKAAPAATKH